MQPAVVPTWTARRDGWRGHDWHVRIAVLMGGTNLDRDTSLVSGWQVAQALREGGHETAAVDTAKPVVGAITGDTFAELGEIEAVPPVGVQPPTRAALSALRRSQGGDVLAAGVLELCLAADCVFVALFGDEGEGGRAQAILDYAGVCFTGPDLLGCAVSFDKDMAKRLVRPTGVPTADWDVAPKGQTDLRPLEDLLPAVVKPVGGGSSIGASVARTPEDLIEAVRTAHATGQDGLVERFLPGREFTVGVLRGQALPPVELDAGRELIDYESKYQEGRTRKTCPAELSDADTELLGQLAVTSHDQLKLGSRTCSRMDFRMNADGEFVFMECNPLPGMTPSSFLPVAARAAGLSFPDLCQEIVGLAGNSDPSR